MNLSKILALIVFVIVSSCKTKEVSLKEKYSDSLDLYYEKGNYCGNANRIEIGKAKQARPFDSTQKINLVSFKIHPIINHKFDQARVFESVTLNEDFKNKLIDILVNYNAEPYESVFCYDPRNAILFLDGKDRVVGYVNLCFECSTANEQSPTLFFLGTNCPEKWHLLKLLFGAAGIKFGITERGIVYYVDADSVYNNVEKSAEPPVGQFREWVEKNIRYPKAASTNRTEGKVYVKFVIEKDGTLSRPEILKGFDPECDREALRVIMNSPKWIPGKVDGKPVRQYYTEVVRFRLKEGK